MSEEGAAAAATEESEKEASSAAEKTDVKSGSEEEKEKAGAEEPKMVRASALAAERDRRQAAEAELTGFRTEKQKAADEKAKAAGDVETAQGERDTYKTELDEWKKHGQTKLDGLLEGFDEKQKGIIDALGENAPLATRLSVAEGLKSLAGDGKESDAPYGSTGGKKTDEKSALIPPSITTGDAYYEWLEAERLSGDAKRMAKLFDDKAMASVTAEARERKLIR